MRLLAYFRTALLGAWCVGCASTVGASSSDAALVDARAEAASDASDGGERMQRGTIAVSSAHACSIDRDGAVWCWGGNTFGQLGDGTTTAHRTAARVAGITGGLRIALGQVSSCAVRADGTVQCWGADLLRVIDQSMPIPNDALILEPRAIDNLSEVLDVSVLSGPSGGVACGIRAPGDVWCWGAADQVPGYPVGIELRAPTGPSSLARVASLQMQLSARCAISPGEGVACWAGRIWDPTFPRGLTTLDGTSDVRDVAIGGGHLCVLSRAGTVRCLGNNARFALGNGGAPAPDLRTLVDVVGATDVVAISAGAGLFTVALRADGTVLQWGTVFDAQLRTATRVDGLSNIVDVSAGFGSACARRADGAVFCWGDNTYGQLGDGTLRSRSVPMRVAGIGP